jgi:plasmid stabilization system protein ParE
MEITFSESALSDLEDIKAYYREQDVPAVGIDLLISIFEHTETLIDHPDIGRVVPEFGEEHIRELIHPPFRIVYLRSLKALQIIRIWRSERLLTINEDNAVYITTA